MSSKNARNKKKNTGGKKGSRLSLELTPGKTLSLGGIVLLALVWAFILGVLVGRGYHPEDVVPKVTSLTPQEEEKQDRSSRVLAPEELDFYDRLRSTPAQREPSEEKEPAAHAPQEQDTVETAALPDSHEPAPETFVYTYQVGSFKDMEKANNLQAKLYQEGFSASITKAFTQEKPWYRVLIEVETTPTQLDDIKQDLEEFGITQPLLRNKRSS